MPSDQLDADGVSVGTVNVNFDRVTLTPITVAFTVTPGPTFPGDGADANQCGAGGVHGISRVSLTQIDSTRLLTPILMVPGHQIGAVTAVRKAGGNDIAVRGNIDLNEKLTLAAGDITITVS